MTWLLSTAGRRFYSKRPWQLLLALTGIALGVAVYVGMALANDSARRAFEVSEALVTGRTTHHLVGVSGGVPNSLYRQLRLQHGPLLAAPVIEDDIRLAQLPGRRLTLLGIDPLEEPAFRNYSGIGPGRAVDLRRLMVEPASILVPASLARELGVDIDSSLDIVANGAITTARIVGTIGESNPDGEEASLPIVTDIASAQEVLQTGSLTRVDLILSQEEFQRIRALALPGVSLLPSVTRNAAFNELASAFRVNLAALSLLALMVGVFLIYATMSFSIVQRRETFGVLRAMGVGRNEILLSVLMEASAIGVAATALGLILGQQLAGSLVDIVLGTIGDLYFSTSVKAASPSALIYWKGMALGVGATILAALAPALEAANAAPHATMSRAALERLARRSTQRAVMFAAPAAVFAVVLFSVAPRSLFAGFAGLFFMTAAGALLIPWSMTWLFRLAEPVAERGFGIPGSLAVRGVPASLSRTGVAAAALSVAVATVIGVGVMIGSFRTSLQEWLNVTLLADIYLGIEESYGAVESPFDDTSVGAIDALPGVAGTSVARFIRLPTSAGDLGLRAVEPGPQGWGLTIMGPSPDRAVAQMEDGNGILVSEPLAFRRQLTMGDELVLPTADGEVSFPILGIFRDYRTDGGGVLMTRDLYRFHWRDEQIDGVGVYFADSADRVSTLAAIRSLFASAPNMRVRSNDLIRVRSLALFDRTFKITEVLRILAGLVAFLGLLSALMSIELERAREIAILRALGLTPRQIGILTLTQTGLLGLAAGLLAVPLGVMMAAALVLIINVRSFGWTMELEVGPAPLLLGLGLAVGASLLAGIYPAKRAAVQSVAARLREE